jgi:uncharacterized membrane protein YgcG
VFTGITSHTCSLVTAIVVLTGAAILGGGAAAADPNQDDQFLRLLNKEDIPALEGVPSLIATAQKICRNLDGGMPVDGLVDAMMNNAYDTDPSARQYPPARLTSTFTRFITAAVEAYCPYDQGKIASIMANPAPGSNELTHRVAAYTPNAVNSESDLREPPAARDMINLPAAWQEPTGTGAVRLPHIDGGVFVAGRSGHNWSDCDAHGAVLASLIGPIPGTVPPPNPPQVPAPSPPTAQPLTPPRPIAAPPPPKQPPRPLQQPPPPPQQPPTPPQAPPPPQEPPPPPQQPPPPPQQVEPPAFGPQPGGAAGSGGGGGAGGGGGGGAGGGGGSGPAEPSPTPPMPPGIIRIAP